MHCFWWNHSYFAEIKGIKLPKNIQMKQFFKFTFASCLGVFLASIVMTILSIVIFSGIVASAGSKKAVVKNHTVLKLDFAEAIPERTNNVQPTGFSLEADNVYGLHDIIAMIEKAGDDDRISGIYMEPLRAGLGMAQSKTLQQALSSFQSKGKFVTAYADYYTQKAYYLASSADRIVVNPIGTVDFRGLASIVPYYKDMLDKVGVKMQVYYAGDFKSATEPFRRNDMSPANRLQTREFLNGVYSTFLEDIADSRKNDLSAKELKDIAYQFKVKLADDALKYKLVDEVGFQPDLFDWMKEKAGLESKDKLPFLTFSEYATVTSYKKYGKSNDRIAIVYAEGEIRDGVETYGQIKDQQYVPLLQKLKKDDRIKAVVLRINSPGGSILAAEKIYQEIIDLKESGKKVVVSMGDLAASGGYYLSAPADSIFASENTLTGSIGVFSVIPNVTELLNEKVGMHFDTVRTGPHSADFTTVYPWSEGESKYLQSRTDYYYDLFLQRVADGRDMSVEDVHKVAQGRIWTGSKALENGLIDGIGELDDAIASAASLAELDEYRLVEYPILKNPTEKLINDLMNPKSLESKVITEKVKQVLPEIRYFDFLKEVGTPQAHMMLQVDW